MAPVLASISVPGGNVTFPEIGPPASGGNVMAPVVGSAVTPGGTVLVTGNVTLPVLESILVPGRKDPPPGPTLAPG